MAWLTLLGAGLLKIVWINQSEGFTRLGPTVATVVAMAASVGAPFIVHADAPNRNCLHGMDLQHSCACMMSRTVVSGPYSVRQSV